MSPINKIRSNIRERNAYNPTAYQKRKASRPYVKGTRQTRKEKGDFVIDERGRCHQI